MTYDIKTGDDTPALAFQLANPDASKPNLTGATITFKLVRVTDGVVVTAAGAMTAIAPAATSGQVQYVFPLNGYPVAGAYRGEISVVYADGRHQAFPGRGFIDIQINAKL